MRSHNKKSIEDLNEANTIVQRVFPQDESLVLHNLARKYFAIGNAGKGIELEKKALQQAEAMKITQYIRLSSSFLKDYYISTGNSKEALKYAIQYYQAKEQILNQKVLVQVKEFSNRIALEKQHQENLRLIYEDQLTRGRMRYYTLSGILLIILLIVISYFLITQNRKRKQIRNIASNLDQSNKVLKRFISILGHDLRSPFNAILGYTELLKNDSSMTHQDQVAAIGRLYTVSHSTYKLLDRLLEWSMIQSGSVTPDFKDCDLCVMIRETLQILGPTALLKKIEFDCDNPGRLPVRADENMIQTVLRNIISNAIKFSFPGGQIFIRAGAGETGLLVSLRDEGVGMKPESLQKLFSLAENYKSTGTAGEPGTGLGLILCQE